ncbi:hypothetical protein FNV43_RR05062 [Rhamnella rubrinervis]|uniref:SHSP domain-containing protein n=1 Tax=Rhamnella rubrinervis TaxID=2594499 RepID=A0A8K0HLY9_9ROSA|nr:hypothetical protein FNV43_RR05062 [Rhamnella rubrinervis]
MQLVSSLRKLVEVVIRAVLFIGPMGKNGAGQYSCWICIKHECSRLSIVFQITAEEFLFLYDSITLSVNPLRSRDLGIGSPRVENVADSKLLRWPTNQHLRSLSLDVWDPFKDLPILRSSLSSSFPELSRENSAFVNTRIDWKETPEAHVFKADVPGLRKEEVKVEVEDDRVLQISGERNVEKEDKNDTWHRVERSTGKFMRRFRLPENAKMDQIKAGMENGVLTVTVPKEEVKKADVKSIQISG